MKYQEYARKCRQDEDFITAGSYYVASAHRYLLNFRRDPDRFDDERFDEATEGTDTLSPKIFRDWRALGPAIRALIAGTLSYKLAGKMDRCRANCRHGIMFLQDIVEHESDDMEEPREGVYYEMIGDLTLIGELGDHEPYYMAAHDRYRGAEHDLGWSLEDDFYDLMLYVLELADSVDYGISDDTREQIYRLSLEARIEFKRDHLPAIIERVVDDGNWESDIF